MNLSKLVKSQIYILALFIIINQLKISFLSEIKLEFLKMNKTVGLRFLDEVAGLELGRTSSTQGPTTLREEEQVNE